MTAIIVLVETDSDSYYCLSGDCGSLTTVAVLMKTLCQ